LYDIILFAVIPSSREEVSEMIALICSFVVSVLAGVVAYYICKWFDGNK
jgi:membrane protein DedA with SNARE-associated domain